MLWRVRATIPNRPGVLASLAKACGEAGVNILGVQVFSDEAEATDEIIIDTPEGWDEERLTALVQKDGRHDVVVQPASAGALADQPTRYVQAARLILERPTAFPEVIAQLFDAEAEPDSEAAGVQDTMDLTIGDVDVTVSRRAPFTTVERERGAVLADLIKDVLEQRRLTGLSSNSLPRSSGDKAPQYVVEGDTINALLDGVAVGFATVHEADVSGDAAGLLVRPVTVRVEAGWQRRGIGTRLLLDAARLANGLGAAEIMLTTSSDNQSMMPLLLAAGMRGRIRMATNMLSVRVPVHDVKPLQRA